jgi:hypothetical protein
MRPGFSEFSYGFALTSELIHWHNTPLKSAPIFPNLIEEGKVGYDAMLDRPGVPLFMQFKLSHHMRYRSASEAARGVLAVPYYRMHLMPAKLSDQHQLLLDLELKGYDVFYTAPLFHTITEFNSKFLSGHLKRDSLWLPPSKIGPLPDDEEHVVVFRSQGEHYFCSEPRSLKGDSSVNNMERQIHKRLVESERQQPIEVINGLNEFIESGIAPGEEVVELKDLAIALRLKRWSDPLARLAAYVQYYMNAQLCWVSWKDGMEGHSMEN